MQVIVESRSAQADAWRELAFYRTQFVMRRLAWLVPRARVRLSDTNGPRGGVDKCCQVELNTVAAGTVVIHAVADGWRGAIDAALAKAARTLLRLWRRRQGSGTVSGSLPSRPAAPARQQPTARQLLRQR